MREISDCVSMNRQLTTWKELCKEGTEGGATEGPMHALTDPSNVDTCWSVFCERAM